MISVAEFYALMDTGDQRYGKSSAYALNQNGNALAGVRHDVLGLGVVGGLLMKEFDGGHFSPFFWIFESIGDKDDAVLLGDEIFCKMAQADLNPNFCKTLKVDGGTMESVPEPVVATVFEILGAHKAGDPEEIAPC